MKPGSLRALSGMAVPCNAAVTQSSECPMTGNDGSSHRFEWRQPALSERSPMAANHRRYASRIAIAFKESNKIFGRCRIVLFGSRHEKYEQVSLYLVSGALQIGIQLASGVSSDSSNTKDSTGSSKALSPHLVNTSCNASCKRDAGRSRTRP